MKTLQELVRPNIWALKPYSCARDEFQGEASVYLDANENPMNAPYNRYPDPLQLSLKEKLAKIKGVRATQIMLGVGSDETIDLSFRIFCEPGQNNVVSITPSYGMYEVCAEVNNIELRQVKLREDFSLDAAAVLKACDEHTKIIFLCSPNNPSGNLLDFEAIKKVLDGFEGVVAVDEAYIDFSPNSSLLKKLDNYPNLMVYQTFSKAWGLAAVRCGMVYASEAIISFFNKVKYPYNINQLTQDLVEQQIVQHQKMRSWVDYLLEQRTELQKQLSEVDFVEMIYPSDANFLLVKVKDANATYQQLTEKGIIVRNRNKIVLCGNCLRISVGTKEENQLLIAALNSL